MNQKLIDKYIGKQYGRLTVTSLHYYRADNDYNKKPRLYAMCNCSCGGCSFSAINNLSNGHTKSCGCIEKEHPNNLQHGHTSNGKVSPTYISWSRMKDRCNNPKNNRYEQYGGRGIKVCRRWANSFDAFLFDMGERPEGKSIDRINVNGNYSKRNCKWSDSYEQRHNRTDSK